MRNCASATCQPEAAIIAREPRALRDRVRRRTKAANFARSLNPKVGAGVRVFISYSTALDQIIALRLQTIAAVYGITVFVPPANTRIFPAYALAPDIQSQLNQAEVVLAVITQQPTESALAEMSYAVQVQRLLIPIVSPGVPSNYYSQFEPYFVVNPADPSETEKEIVRYLREKQQQGSGKTAIAALAIFAVALLLLGGGDTK